MQVLTCAMRRIAFKVSCNFQNESGENVKEQCTYITHRAILNQKGAIILIFWSLVKIYPQFHLLLFLQDVLESRIYFGFHKYFHPSKITAVIGHIFWLVILIFHQNSWVLSKLVITYIFFAPFWYKTPHSVIFYVHWSNSQLAQ